MKFANLYNKHVQDLGAPGVDGEAKGLCPFHEDTNPSFGVNLESGKWRCYSSNCNKRGGVKKFKDLLGIGKPKPIPEAEIDAHHQALLTTPRVLEYLHKERHLSLEIIKRYKLGYDGERILIPIRDARGVIVNGRKYPAGSAP